MNKEQFLKTGLLEQFALGLTDAEESVLVERYLQQFPELQDELYAMQKALEQYAQQYTIPSVSTTPQNGPQSTGMQPSPAQSPPVQLPWSKWLSYATLIALTLGYLYQSNRFQQSRQALRDTSTALSSCESQNQTLREYQRVYALITAPQTQVITLTGSTTPSGAQAIVYWNAAQQQAFCQTGLLPDPPNNQQYQIWADVDGSMVSIGLIDSPAQNLQVIDYIAQAESLNITLEPLGGSNTPTISQLYVTARL
jgi:anti-sigma-K factor RskA